MNAFWSVILYIGVAPIIGGLVNGLDRKLSARMQRRVGPPLIQPFYDLLKLLDKETLIVSGLQSLFPLGYLLFIVTTGAIFFAGGDLLLAIFTFTLGSAYLVLGAFSSRSPYSHLGAQRELIQILAYEPMVLITIVGFAMVTGSFNVAEIVQYPKPLIMPLFGIFLGFIFILTIKLRKSPFDLSTSHHAHQEIVKGVTTEFSGASLAMIELAHWYELVFLFGFIALFVACCPLLAVWVIAGVYFLEVVIDNTMSRFKWQLVLLSAWSVTILFGVINIAAL